MTSCLVRGVKESRGSAGWCCLRGERRGVRGVDRAEESYAAGGMRLRGDAKRRVAERIIDEIIPGLHKSAYLYYFICRMISLMLCGRSN